jgi:hypothetical protein
MEQAPASAGRAAGPWRVLAREPLVHFLVAGVLLFALYALVVDPGQPEPDAIAVTAAQVDALAAGFARTWGRPPAPAELDELVDEYVVEELFYREALALGLDRDDTVIRRRLRQKMEFLADAPGEASDAELAAHLAAHPERFTAPPRTSFRQVFLAADRPDGVAAAERLRARLESGAVTDPLAAGDPTLLPPGLDAATGRDIESAFGAELATALDTLPLDRWSGPVRSTYGWHLVQVTARTAGSVPDLAAIRPAVLADWQESQRRAALAASVAVLRAKYRVSIVARPAAGPDAPRP